MGALFTVYRSTRVLAGGLWSSIKRFKQFRGGKHLLRRVVSWRRNLTQTALRNITCSQPYIQSVPSGCLDADVPWEMQTRTIKREGVREKKNMSAFVQSFGAYTCGQTCAPRDYQDLASQSPLRDSAGPPWPLAVQVWMGKFPQVLKAAIIKRQNVCGCSPRRIPHGQRPRALGWFLLWTLHSSRRCSQGIPYPAGQHKRMEDLPRTVVLEPHDMKTMTH